MKKFSFILILCLGAFLMGCSSTPNTETVTTTISVENTKQEGEQPKEELIKILPELTLKYETNIDSTKVIGTATNNNKVQCNFDFDVIFFNEDGSILTTETLQVCDIKPGETKYFDSMVMDNDVSKGTYKIQFGEFFTYTK